MTRRFACIGALFGALCSFVWAAPAWAQLTLPTAPASAPPGIRQEGVYYTTPVFLDGTLVFRLATPIAGSPNQMPIGIRKEYVETALAQVLNISSSTGRTIYDPATLAVRVKNEGNVATIEAVDARHKDPIPIVTVTPADAQYAGTNLATLATRWQGALQSALVHSLQIRQPAAQHRSVELVLRAAAVLVVVSVLVWRLVAFLRGRMDQLQRLVESRERLAEEQPTQRKFFAVALRNIEPERRLALYVAGSEVLLWLLVLAWFLATVWAFSLFPQTTVLAQIVEHRAFGVATTLIVTGLLNRIIDVAIVHFARAWRVAPFRHSEDRARELLRIPTIAKAFSGFKTFVLAFCALLSILGQLGVPVSQVVTIGGVLAIALSLAAQNFVRDFLNGFLVLLEDQYVVGDYVTINAFSGLVEKLTLRMVQIRDIEGNLITIPHNAVNTVVNQSRNWSRVHYRLPIDPSADVRRAIELVRTTIEAMAKEENWQQMMIEPLEWIGIEDISRDGIVVRASIKTAPLRQFELRRALNERVRHAFAEAKIPFGAIVVAPS